MKQIKLSLLLITLSIFLSSCGFEFDYFESSSETYREYDNAIVNPEALSSNWSNYNGNLTLVNNSGETIVVSTNKSFRDDFGVDFYKFSSSSFQIDMRDYGDSDDLVKFYATTLANLEHAHNYGAFRDGSVKESIAFIPSYGGTWSPFGSNYTDFNKDTGILVISNHSEQILKVVIKDINNQPEGQINRGETNVRLEVPADGLYPVYILNAETLELIEQYEIGISKNAIEYIEVGEKTAVAYSADIKIINNTELHFNAYNRFTRAPMPNENCNGCSTIIKGESGLFTVTGGIDVQIQLESTSGNNFLQSELLNLAQGQSSKWVIQRDSDGNLELTTFQNSNVAKFSYTVYDTFLGETHSFTADEPYAAYYYWSFSDGYYSYYSNPIHNFEKPGIYTVELTTSSFSGVTETTSLNVLVQ